MLDSFFLRMLNREASAPGSGADKIIDALGVKEGEVIADLGSGGGYFSCEFARRVGKTGRVYAVDVKERNLSFVERLCEQEGLKNVTFVLARGKQMDLPEGGVDLAFARNTFHHLPEPVSYFENFRRYLRSGGKVAIIEHKPKKGLSFVALFRHYTPQEVILQKMNEAGYSLVESFNFLPGQVFDLFGID